MKKLIILSTLIVSTQLLAQTYPQAVRNARDIKASSYEVAPGVYVSPPMWARDLGGPNTSIKGGINNENSNSAGVESQDQNSGLIPSLENSKVGSNVRVNVSAQPKTEQPQLSGDKNKIEKSPEKINPPTIPNNLNKTVSIPYTKPVSKAAIVERSISSWNRTTQLEVEAKAELELQTKYKEFLMKK